MAKILIVDDSSFARHRIQTLLEAGGHEVVGTAADGRSALSQYKALRPDIVTMDYFMDETPGEVALRAILEFDPEAKVIMVSGSNDGSLKDRVMKEGALGFVEKFSPETNLLEMVDSVGSHRD
ncbi:MAG: response regulator [Lysobacterales bacterium]|jgi:two-component system chemotaxis response regulator CheY